VQPWQYTLTRLPETTGSTGPLILQVSGQLFNSMDLRDNGLTVALVLGQPGLRKSVPPRRTVRPELAVALKINLLASRR
jgi:hypothetical protein